ncbi:MAG: AraC family transcriptional regulator [Eubacterium sp.]
MKGQNDWYTGTDYYDNYPEKEIIIEEKTIELPLRQDLHPQVEILYIKSGKARIEVNGWNYAAEEGSFFCMYSHHFYRIHAIQEKLEIVFVKFYVGLFMYMCWEKHPKNANAKLMYDTCPMVSLTGIKKKRIELLVDELLEEKKTYRFETKNLVMYKTLELHAYYCRYAFEAIGKNKKEDNKVWNLIEKVILTTGQKILLEDAAEEMGYTPRQLNQKIKAVSGSTFFQLKQAGKVLNSCSLLHFPELEIDYISDLLGFSSITVFYRVFQQYCKMTPREYQRKKIGNDDMIFMGTSLAMQFLQYIHLYFMQDLTLEGLSDVFYVKPYRVEQIFKNVFGVSFKNLLNEIRISYAASFLRTKCYTVLEVSSMCGFESHTTFQRAFKTYMHQTPSEYLKYA